MALCHAALFLEQSDIIPRSIVFMLTIRLARGGAKKRPFYNIVVTDSRHRRDGRFIERIGFYNPFASKNDCALRLAQDRLAYWKNTGVQLSETVARLVKQARRAAASSEVCVP